MSVKVTRIAVSGQELAGGGTLSADYPGPGDEVDVTTGLPLDGLLDVNAPAPDDQDVLTWDGGAGEWIAQAATGSALTVSDEGTPLATAATTLDFVGAGVVASGTGAAKTITIAGGGADTSGQFIAGWDGGGVELETGKAVDIVAPFTGTITSWTLLPDQSGSAVVDIATDTYAGYPTFTSIVASDPPTLTSTTKATGSALTGWTTAVTAGDILRFTLSSTSTVTRLLCVVAYSRP